MAPQYTSFSSAHTGIHRDFRRSSHWSDITVIHTLVLKCLLIAAALGELLFTWSSVGIFYSVLENAVYLYTIHRGCQHGVLSWMSLVSLICSCESCIYITEKRQKIHQWSSHWECKLGWCTGNIKLFFPHSRQTCWRFLTWHYQGFWGEVFNSGPQRKFLLAQKESDSSFGRITKIPRLF